MFDDELITEKVFMAYEEEAQICRKLDQQLSDIFSQLQGITVKDSMVSLNIGGKKVDYLRDVCHNFSSANGFCALFNGRWDCLMDHDEENRIFLDLDPHWVNPLFDYLEQLEAAGGDSGKVFVEKSSPFYEEGFEAVASYFGLVMKPFAPPITPSTPSVKWTTVIDWVEDEAALNYLHSLLPDYTAAQLLFRASRDGYRGSDFHRKCDNISHLLVIIRDLDGNIFGGFTDGACFKSSNEYVSTAGYAPFLFNLRKDGQSLYCKETITNHTHGLYDKANGGPAFGSGFDLYIDDSCNITGSKNAGHYRGSTYTNNAGYPYGYGYIYFVVADYEVYALTKDNSPTKSTPLVPIGQQLFHYPAFSAIQVNKQSRRVVSGGVIDVHCPFPHMNEVGAALSLQIKLREDFVVQLSKCREALLKRALPLLNEMYFVVRHCHVPLPDTLQQHQPNGHSPRDGGVQTPSCSAAAAAPERTCDTVIAELQSLLIAILQEIDKRSDNVAGADLIHINARGTLLTIRKSTILHHVPENSLLYAMATHTAAQEEKSAAQFELDKNGYIFLKMNPELLEPILSYFRFKDILKYNTTDYTPRIIIAEEKVVELEKVLASLQLNEIPIEAVRANYSIVK